MGRFIAAILLLFTVSSGGNSGVQAQDNWDNLTATPERLIGLLDLPDIVQGGCGSAPKRATARAFSTPAQSGSTVGTIYWDQASDAFCGLMIEHAGGVKERVPTLESGYEIPAAIVFERRDAWFRVRLAKGSVWIHHNDPTDFLPYPELVRPSPHTMQTWDGTLRRTPGLSGQVIPLPSGWKVLLDRQLNIHYLGSQRVGKELWLHIRLAAKAGCDQIYEGVTDVEGWIPAYHTDRTTLVWFSSRGC